MEKFIKIMAVVNVLIVLHMICGCEDSQSRKVGYEYDLSHKDVVERDGCEYLAMSSGHSMIYSHKGDCKNPIHVYARKEEDEEDQVKKNREEKRKRK